MIAIDCTFVAYWFRINCILILHWLQLIAHWLCIHCTYLAYWLIIDCYWLLIQCASIAHCALIVSWLRNDYILIAQWLHIYCLLMVIDHGPAYVKCWRQCFCPLLWCNVLLKRASQMIQSLICSAKETLLRSLCRGNKRRNCAAQGIKHFLDHFTRTYRTL